MKRLMGLLLALLLLVFAALLVGCEGNAPAATDSESSTDDGAGEAQKSKAPDFTVTDGDGRAVTLSSYFGKPIVLNFWASWCGPCKMEMPDFQETFEARGEEVQFLMVNLTTGRETLTTAKQHIATCGYTLPVLFDTSAEAASVYRVSSIPTTYFIDAEGYLVAQATGMIDAETLGRGIDMICE